MRKITETVDAIRLRTGQSRALIGNAGAIAVGNVATAALGFLFWAVAARSFTPEAVGHASAAISLMSFAALVGESGLGTLLLGEIPRDRERAPQLVSAVLLSALVMSVLCGLAAVAVCQVLSTKLGAVLSTFGGMLLFILASAASGFALVLDGVLIGLLRSHHQLLRNVGQSALKLFLLLCFALSAPDAYGEMTIFSTWAIATLVSVLLIGWLAFRNGERLWVSPSFDSLKGLMPTSLKHHTMNIVALAPSVILPFVVATTLSAETNAAFFAGWMLLGVVLMIPAALTTVLFTVGVKNPHELAHNVVLSLTVSGLAGCGATVGFYALGDFILALFNPVYPETMGPSLQILGISVFPVAVKYHYIAMQRLHQKMLPASLMLGAGALAELVFAIAGARLGGLWGLTTGWLIAVFAEALFMLPVVWTALQWNWRMRVTAL